MVKRNQSCALVLASLLVSSISVVAMEQDPLKPKKVSVPIAPQEKLARLQSLQDISSSEQSQFRAHQMNRKEKNEYEKALLDEYKRDQEIEHLKQQLLAKEMHGGPHVGFLAEAVSDVSELLAMETDDYFKNEFDEQCEPTDVQIQLHWKKQLENAIKLANILETKKMLEKNVPLDMHDEFGDTPLHWALVTELATPEKISLLQLLIDAGANINAVNNAGRTPMHLAALVLDGTPEVLAFMHAQCAIADLSLMDMQFQTPLHAAVSKGRSDLVKVFLLNRADVHARNLNGLTPLQVVFESGLTYPQKCAIVPDLIEAGADVDVCDDERTPLLFKAIKLVDVTGVELLLGHGANFNVTDVKNRTALEFAHHKVATSSNDNTRKILDLVQSYVDGRKVPRRYTEHTPKVNAKRPPGVWISIPLILQDKVDEKLFQEKVYSEFQKTDASGKTKLQRILEDCYVPKKQSLSDDVK